MKNFNLVIIMATIFIIAEQPAIGYDKTADDSQPTHQGFGRIGTAIGNTLTLHPGNAVNSLATGDQSDTTFGWHEDDDNRIKANRSHTEHNNNKDLRHAKHRQDRRNDNRNEHELRREEENLENELRREEEDLDHELRHEEAIDHEKKNKHRRWFW